MKTFCAPDPAGAPTGSYEVGNASLAEFDAADATERASVAVMNRESPRLEFVVESPKTKWDVP